MRRTRLPRRKSGVPWASTWLGPAPGHLTHMASFQPQTMGTSPLGQMRKVSSARVAVPGPRPVSLIPESVFVAGMLSSLLSLCSSPPHLWAFGSHSYRGNGHITLRIWGKKPSRLTALPMLFLPGMLLLSSAGLRNSGLRLQTPQLASPYPAESRHPLLSDLLAEL